MAGEFGGRLKRRGRQVIASPTECCYLDFDLGVTDLEQAYSFRPIPAQVPELNSPLLFSPKTNDLKAYSFRPIPAQVPELNSPVLFSP